MATPKKTAKKTTKSAVKKVRDTLIWKKHSEGGDYAIYKLGAIFRYNGKYTYRTSYNHFYNATSLAEAKRKIDAYTKEVYIKNKIAIKKTTVSKSKTKKKVTKKSKK